MASKFKTNLTLSHKGILEKRSKVIEEDAIAALDKELIDNADKIRTINREILDLEDLSPDSTISLNPTNGKFDAQGWVRSLVNKRMDLADLEEQKTILEAIQAEYFTEDKKGK